VLPGLPSNKKNSSYHHNSYNKGPNLVFFSFRESPSNSLPTIKFPKNHITSSYHSNMTQNSKGQIWPLRTLGIKGHFTLRPSSERRKDSSNLIGGEQNFVHWAFTLKTTGFQNIYTASLFGSLVLRICLVENSLFAI
jgi:hypothetical protein